MNTFCAAHNAALETGQCGERPEVSWTRELRMLRQGGLLIYPTETFYALGCLATDHSAVERVFTAKGRSRKKTVPLVVSSWAMVEKFLRLSRVARALAKTFWPGPLSIVTDVDESISALARDGAGQAAVRMTPHPVARILCELAEAPLVSSSANFSGGAPVCAPQDLDAGLVRLSGAMVIDAEPWPRGGLPSTLVKPADGRALRVLREGAVRVSELTAQGYEIV